MIEVGDGLEGQPTEGVATLSDLAVLMDGGEEAVDALDESADGEEAEGSEESEAAEEEAQSEGEEEAEEPVFTIKVDGKDVELPQSKLIEMAQQGTDYTKKTMALADDRRAFESEREQVKAVRAEVDKTRDQAINDLRAVHEFMQAQIGEPPDISLLSQDAQQYFLAKEWHESQRAKLGQVSQALQTLLQQQESERANQRKKRQDEAERQLADTLPGWKDAPEQTLKALVDYITPLGLTPDVVGETAFTAGLWQLAHKAREYDRLQAEKSKLKPVQSLPKVAKPGTNNQPAQLARRQEAMKRHKAAPSISTLADLI